MTDVWIRCQACGESWPMEEEIQHDCTDQYSCPDCEYVTVYPDGTELRCGGNSEHGSPDSSGTAGARGRLTLVSDLLALAQRGVSTIQGDGSNTYQGLLRDILSRSKEDSEGEFILMASFTSATYQRLSDALSGDRGSAAMDDALCSLTIVIAERPST